MMLKKPDWLRVPYFDNEDSLLVTELIKELNLNTVCIEANCPNRAECFSKKTATFMILGSICTRNCAFCNVSNGTPQPVDKDEPLRVAAAVKQLGLEYVVITSVTRDDLPDGGAAHFAEVIEEIKKISPDTAVEVLIPDLTSLEVIAGKKPEVISHNIETVESLYSAIRPEAGYKRSLNVLRSINDLNKSIRVKSGLMLGLGETREEILKTLDDLLEHNCDILTIGQYLSPSKAHYPVAEYIEPTVFVEYENIAKEKGFRFVKSGPFVRSSYNAEEAYQVMIERE
ncbi:MAG: lipoyl synthase [Oscillospiraceae bacterium]|nr:lipoyl synthase [Oscillospiraceae bacterium]